MSWGEKLREKRYIGKNVTGRNVTGRNVSGRNGVPPLPFVARNDFLKRKSRGPLGRNHSLSSIIN